MDKIREDLGALKEGMGWIRAEVTELRKDVKHLNGFKWKLIGISGTVTFLISLLVAFFGRG